MSGQEKKTESLLSFEDRRKIVDQLMVMATGKDDKLALRAIEKILAMDADNIRIQKERETNGKK